MGKFPDNAVIWGFTYIDNIGYLDLDEIHNRLLDKKVNLGEVIFSTCEDKDDYTTWVVAASRYLSEDEVMESIDFIIENSESIKKFELGGND